MGRSKYAGFFRIPGTSRDATADETDECMKQQHVNDDDEELEQAMLLRSWEKTVRIKQRYRVRDTLVALSYIIVAGITYAATRHFGQCICNCVENEVLSPFMAGIDRSYHFETGNAATSLSRKAEDPDAANQSWNNFTVSTAEGGDEIEDWWLDLGTYTTPVLVPEEYGDHFGFDPNKHSIVRPGDDGYAPGQVPYAGYPASIEVMHKLHCLNFLRQATYYNHQFYRDLHGKPWHLGEHDLVRHIGHCVDIFRQKILCEAEIELVPFEKSTSAHKRNDWARPKKCRNFAAVRNWLADHQWAPGDPDFYLDDHHKFSNSRPTVTKTPRHSIEELWRGY